MIDQPSSAFKTPKYLIWTISILGAAYLFLSFNTIATSQKLNNIEPIPSVQNQLPNKKRTVPVQLVKSPQGLEAWLVEDHSVPVISIDFSFTGGMSSEPQDKMGLNYMLSIMMDEGAGDYDSQAFQKQLEDLVISMAFSAGRDYFTGHLKTLTKNRGKAVEMLQLALTEPHFSQNSLERMQQSTINSIKSNLGSPGWNAARIFNGLTFKGHAYARPGQGNLKTIPNITSDDLRKLSSTMFTKSGLKISAAGDITAEDLSKVLDVLFSTLPGKQQVLVDDTKKDAYNPSIAGKTIVYNMDIPQSIIQFGQPGISHLDPDYPAAMVLNYILGGGGFASRLMQSLREDGGLTYGIYTSISHTKNADLLQGQFSTKNETVHQAIELLKQEWQKMADNGPTAQEVEDAINYLTGSLPLALTSTSKISGILSGLQKYGRDIEYINKRNDLLHAVTAEDVRKMAKRLLTTDKINFIIVGKPVGLNNIETITELPNML